MSAVNELAAVIGNKPDNVNQIGKIAAAERVLAAGYRKPAAVTTIGTLPNKAGSVILTAQGKVMVLMPGMYSQHHWQTPNSAVWWSPIVDWLPATVLHDPEAQS